MRDNVFIGWSGNQSLAIELGNIINEEGQYSAIVGGGNPNDMYVGAQVISQIKESDYAIMLMEKKDGKDVSTNLWVELGYVLAILPFKKVFIVMINISNNDLPSDIQGMWNSGEKIFDRGNRSEADFAKEIYEQFRDRKHENANYFDIINNWKNCFIDLRNDTRISTKDIEYIIFGCLAAYYYDDNAELKSALNLIAGDEAINDIVLFGKTYIDVFLESGNMAKPLNLDQMYNFVETFESLLERNRRLDDKLDSFVDILCHDACGLACSLYLRNPDIDDEMREYFNRLCHEHLHKTLELLDEYVERFGEDNKHVVLLLRAYINNDLSQLYRYNPDEQERFLEYLSRSVDARKALFKAVQANYPYNTFLIEKMEQEYMIALSAQCKYIPDPIRKKITVNKIKNRVEQWENDYKSLITLIQRIQVNLKEINS